MIVDAKLMRYLAACQAANTPESTVEWMEVCPECGDVPQPYDSDHLILAVGDGPIESRLLAVIVACEGYYAVDPAKLGLGDEHPNWTAPDAETFVGTATAECTCGEIRGWGHFPTCPAVTVGPIKG